MRGLRRVMRTVLCTLQIDGADQGCKSTEPRVKGEDPKGIQPHLKLALPQGIPTPAAAGGRK